MKNMRVLAWIMIITIILSGSALWAAGQRETAEPDEVTLEFWTFQELHSTFYTTMADRWNAEGKHPRINLEVNSLPYEEMHDMLLVALQSGVGAPDIVDIEINRFPNYLRGRVQLESFNDVIDPIRDSFVTARFDIYSKDGEVYGLPFHVGASVMYYNTEIMDAAGVDIDSIDTWDDFYEAGKKVLSATGKPMISLEVTDQWSYWPLISQQGSDFFDADGNPIFDNDINIKTLEFLLNMVDEGIAVTTPGGNHHAEEYYGFMNSGGTAAMGMPMWYMGRFTDYMPDLKDKILIRPLPRWTPDGYRSAGMGGTGTAVTSQSDHIDVAKEFLAYSKLSVDGNIAMWTELGFDPPRWDVWDMPEMNAPNKFTEYFVNDNIFVTLLEVKDEIYPVNVVADLPEGINLLQNAIFQALHDKSKTPAQALQDVANELRR